MKRVMRKMNDQGDKNVAEYDVLTDSPQRLADIEREFNHMMRNGYWAVDITDKKDEVIHHFDPRADILLIPRVQGG